MKVLVVGAGRMGSIRTEDLVADSRVSEVLIANRSADKAVSLASKYGAKAIDWDSVKDCDAEAVVVAVGTDAHTDILKPLLVQGRHILCEKPISMDLQSTAEVIDLAKQAGSNIQVGFQRRFDPEFIEIRQQILAGQVGTLYALTMISHDRAPSPREFIAGSGGIFRDLHVHDFDLIRWLTGAEVESVFATKAVRENFDYADFNDADVSTVLVKMQNGVQVLVNGTRQSPLGHDVRLEVFGSKNSVAAGLNSRTPLKTIEQDVHMNDNPYTGFVDRFRQAFKNETESFVSFTLGKIDNPCPPEAALESLRIAIACEESVAKQAAIVVAEVA